MVKPRTMQGVMELLPRAQIAFQQAFDTVRRGFERFGYAPVETPVIELTDVLLTKSGGDTEKQVYFVQSTGARQQGKDPDLALRFDLTVPLARYVAEHEGQLTFPFRRYQMQRVYRGERAQRGRYREFYQCDIDVIGKDSLDPRYDAEVPAVIIGIFEELAIGDFTVAINNRRVLLGLLGSLGIATALQPIVLREIDKIDKRGLDAVAETLRGDGFDLSAPVVDGITRFLGITGDAREVLTQLQATGIDEAQYLEGVRELEEVITGLESLGVNPDCYR
ncbi:MAG: histidine--tRNA ligase family protein, partial [Planctomycetes bacterium]|nr:histidine--tRNA ligase family protein [Planctomycetota bacterium]